MPRSSTLLFILVVTVNVAAAERGVSPTGTHLPMPALVDNDGSIAGLFTENFEAGFPVGLLDGVNGWQAGNFGGNMYVTATGLIPGEGGFAAVHASDGGGLGGFEMDSPDFGPTFGTVSADVRISGTGSLYQFVLLDRGNFFFITRMNFETDGRITIGQSDPDPDVDGFVFFDTGFTWSANVATRICATPEADGTLVVFVNGDLALLGTSAAHNAFNEGDTMTAPAGVGRIMTFSDNVGLGVVDPGADMIAGTFDDFPTVVGDNYVLDNIGGDVCDSPVEPCPGDTNGDLVIDIDDIVNVILDFGCAAGPACPNGGEVNDVVPVDIDDIVFVVLNFGTTCAPAGQNNDLCVDALDLFFGGSVTFDSGDTLDGGAPACGSDPTTDAWFDYYATCNGTITIDTIGSTYNTIVEVYDTHGCPAVAGDLLGCDDDGALASSDPDPLHPANFDSEMTVAILDGQLLKIRVVGSAFPLIELGAGSGELTVTVNCSPPVRPANDECVDAELISTLPYTTIGQTNTATADPADNFFCGDCQGGGVFGTGPAVWYQVQGTGETMTASMCATAVPYDAMMNVFCGDPSNCAANGGFSTLICSVSDDDGCGRLGDGTVSTVTWCSSASQSYMICIGGILAGDTGTFTLDVTSDGAACAPAQICFVPPICSGDDCADAIPIGQGLTGYSNIQATTDGPPHLAFCGDDSGDGGQTTEDIWFTYTAAAAPPGTEQVLLVTTCEQLGGSANHDSDLKLYEGTSCDEQDLLANIIACNDDDPANQCGTGGGGLHSTIIAPVTPGQEYLIRLGSWFTGNTGNGNLLVFQFEPISELCEFADPIVADGSTITVDTTDALVDAVEPCAGGAPFDAPGIWLSTVGDGTEYTVTVCSLLPVLWDTRVTVYCSDCLNLTCIDEPSDNALACGPNETLTWCTFPGLEYTIHVSGVGGASGTAEVTLDSAAACTTPACLPADECGAGNGFYQPRTPPDGSWTFGTTDVNIDLLRFEGLGSFAGTIDTVRWWGLDARFVTGGGFADCNDPDIDFEIVVYGDAGGAPDPANSLLVYTSSVDGAASETLSEVYTTAGGVDFQCMQWEATLPATVDLVAALGAQPQYYLSIQDTDDDVCLFLWANSPVGNGFSFELDQDPATNPSGTIQVETFGGGPHADLAVCIDPVP